MIHSHIIIMVSNLWISQVTEAFELLTVVVVCDVEGHNAALPHHSGNVFVQILFELLVDVTD